jgi:hypothetical protein
MPQVVEAKLCSTKPGQPIIPNKTPRQPGTAGEYKAVTTQGSKTTDGLSVSQLPVVRLQQSQLKPCKGQKFYI